MAADYIDKTTNPFYIMTQLQIKTINGKISTIEAKIIETESNLKQLISKDNKIKVMMGQVKENFEKYDEKYRH